MTETSEAGSSTRPRRSARTPAKAPTRKPVATAEPGPQSKRKARASAKSPEEELEYLLANAKSELTKVDISVSEKHLNHAQSRPPRLNRVRHTERSQLQQLPGAFRRVAAATVLAASAHRILNVQTFSVSHAPGLPIPTAVRGRDGRRPDTSYAGPYHLHVTVLPLRRTHVAGPSVLCVVGPEGSRRS